MARLEVKNQIGIDEAEREKRARIKPFGPPPDSSDIKDWVRQLSVDVEEIVRLNPPVDDGTRTRTLV